VLLRAALVWNDEVMGDVVLDEPEAITLGSTPGATFVIPDLRLPAEFAILKPGNRGYLLTLAASMRGTVHLDGESRDVADFVQRGGEGGVGDGGGFRATAIGHRDWGVVDLDASGTYKLFFQFVAPERAPFQNGLAKAMRFAGLYTGLSAALLLVTLTSICLVRGFALDDAIIAGMFGAVVGLIAILGISFATGALINANGDQHASLALSIFLHLAFLLAAYRFLPYESPFVWPGRRDLTGEFLVTRMDPPPPEPEIVEPLVKGDGEAADEAAPLAPKPEAVKSATKGDEGAAGGEGDEPRATDPNALDVPPAPPKVGLFTDENRKILDNVIPADLATSLSKFTGMVGPTLARGGIGSGTGTGTGFGPGVNGTGTTRGSTGKGPGGGGSAQGDFQSSGKIDTGETRKPGGTGGTGSAIKEAKVGFAGGGSGDLDGLSMGEIDKVVKSRAGVLKACYQRELNRSPGIGGKLVVTFTIAADGSVKSTRIAPDKSTLRNAAVESCVKGQIARLKFPAKGGGLVNYPFVFSQGG
jgi:hypothetical protein